MQICYREQSKNNAEAIIVLYINVPSPYVIMSSFYCIYTILSNADRDIGYLLFLWPYKYAPMAATHGTVDIMPTEPAIALISSTATKSVFINWIKDTP